MSVAYICDYCDHHEYGTTKLPHGWIEYNENDFCDEECKQCHIDDYESDSESDDYEYMLEQLEVRND